MEKEDSRDGIALDICVEKKGSPKKANAKL